MKPPLMFVLVVGLVAATTVLLLARRRSTSGGGGHTTRSATNTAAPDIDGRLVVRLEFPVADPAVPAAKRLLERTAEMHFVDDLVKLVEVRDADDKLIGSVPRRVSPTVTSPGPADPIPAVEPDPGDSRHFDDPVAASAAIGPLTPSVPTPISARLELPAAVLDLLDDDPDVGEVVEAVLSAAGTAYTKRSGGLVVGDIAVIPIDYRHRLDENQLNQAFLRFEATGARHGVALTMGVLPHHELRRRYALAPRFRHGGPEALQLLADDVALGVDPMTTLRTLAAAPLVGAR